MGSIWLSKTISDDLEVPCFFRKVLIVFGGSIIFLFLLLFYPISSYYRYIAVFSDKKITFTISQKDFDVLEKSTLFIKEKKYDFRIIEKKEQSQEQIIITLQLDHTLHELDQVIEITMKTEKQKIIDHIFQKLRKEFLLL